MHNKKIKERIILDTFIKLFDEMPRGKFIAGESPDFLLRLKPRKAIGIELTGLIGHDFVNHADKLINPKNIIPHLEDTIRKKEEKIYLYRKNRLVELWLLIHLETLIHMNNFHLGHKLEKLHFASGFDRIFLLESNKGKLYELQTASL